MGVYKEDPEGGAPFRRFSSHIHINVHVKLFFKAHLCFDLNLLTPEAVHPGSTSEPLALDLENPDLKRSNGRQTDRSCMWVHPLSRVKHGGGRQRRGESVWRPGGRASSIAQCACEGIATPAGL